MKYRPRVFHTLHQFRAWVDGRECTSSHSSEGRNDNGDKSWVHYATWDEAQKAAQFGSPHHYERVSELKKRVESLIPDLLVTEEALFWDVAPGLGFDIGRAIEGEPEVWFSFRERSVDEVSLVVDGCFHCNIGAAEIERMGAAAAVLIEALQSHGIGVRAWKVFVAKGNSGLGAAHAVCVQQPDSPLDTDAMGYYMASSDFFRRQLFDAWDHEDTDVRDSLSWSLGRPAPVSSVLDEAQFSPWRIAFGDSAIVVPNDCLQQEFGDDEKAAAWVMKNLATITGEQVCPA